jgi:hypothetical protein
MSDHPLCFKWKVQLPELAPEDVANLLSMGVDIESLAIREKDFVWELWFAYSSGRWRE